MALLQVVGLGVSLAGRPVVEDLHLDVAAGQVVALLGPSGAGKTTALRALAGLEPHVGSVRLDGRDLAGVPPERRGMGLMFQHYALFPHLDVGGNVAFGLRMRGVRRAAAAGRVNDVLRLVGLDGFAGRPVTSLSGGEQQRVALARALAPEPQVLLLDEPLGSLDRSLRDHLAVELRDLFGRLGVTVVTVTHDQSEAFTVADRVAVLRAGRLVQVASPVEVWSRPADAFVAGFLGLTNLLPVTVSDGWVESPWGRLAVPDRSDGPAVLVLRPDGLVVHRDRVTVDQAPGSSPVVTAVAGAAGFRGDHWTIPITVLDGPKVDAIVRGTWVPGTGERVAVALERESFVVVDPSVAE
jgi:thiamine transport system ATP-binding protein